MVIPLFQLLAILFGKWHPPNRGTPATATTRGNPHPMATMILSQAGLSNPGVSLRKALALLSCLQTLACILKVFPSYTGSDRSESPAEVSRKETRNKIKKKNLKGVGSCILSHFLSFAETILWHRYHVLAGLSKFLWFSLFYYPLATSTDFQDCYEVDIIIGLMGHLMASYYNGVRYINLNTPYLLKDYTRLRWMTLNPNEKGNSLT